MKAADAGGLQRDVYTIYISADMRIPASPPPTDLPALAERLGPAKLLDASPLDDKQRYLSWDEFRRRPRTDGLSAMDAWGLMRFARMSRAVQLPFRDKSGRPFTVSEVGPLRNQLHRIDSGCRGQLASATAPIPAEQADFYFVRSLIEEPYSSSVYEGAITTRERAKEIISEGRSAITRDERMVLNNYRAMEFIKENLHADLTPQLLFDLHSVITEGTLDKKDAAGRMRRSDERIAVWNDGTGELVHEPPPSAELAERIDRLCAFANEDYEKADQFLNPVTRAIMLHFMIGYDHPFVDGNGRTARSLFYWYVLKHGYWLLEYVSISKIIREETGRRYELAYLNSELDSADATYFVLYHLSIITRAIEALKDYLAKKSKELDAVTASVERMNRDGTINHRQATVLAAALKHNNRMFTIAEHQRSHGVVYLTARKDLEQLHELGYLDRRKRGRQWQYKIAPEALAAIGSV